MNKRSALLLFITATTLFVVAGAEVDHSKLDWAQLVERMATRADSMENSTCRTAVVLGSITRAVPEISDVRVNAVYLIVKIDRVLKQFNLVDIHDDDFEKNNKETFTEWPELKAGETICVKMPFRTGMEQIGKHVFDLVIPITAAKNRFKELAEIYEIEKFDSGEMKKAIADNGLQAIPLDVSWFELVDNHLIHKANWDEFFARVEMEAEIIGLLNEDDAHIMKLVTEKYKPTDTAILDSLRNHVSVDVQECVADLLLENGDASGLQIYGDMIKKVWIDLMSDTYSLPDPGAPAVHTMEWHDKYVTVYQMKLPMLLSDLRKHVKSPLLDVGSIDTKVLLKWLGQEKHPELTFDKEKKLFHSK